MTAETSGEQIAQPTGTNDGAWSVRIRRSKTDRILAGVCGGIAASYGADPTAVRLLAAIIGVLTGIVPMVVLYLVAAVIIPEATDGEASAALGAHSRIDPGQGALVIGAVLIVVGVAALANELFRIEWDVIWPIALIGFGGVVVLMAARR